LKKSLILVLVIALVIMPFTLGAGRAPERTTVIVGFNNGIDRAAVTAHGGRVLKQFDFINALVVDLPSKAAYALSQNPNVKYVEANHTAYATAQTLPWGIDRVKAPQVQALGVSGTGIKVAVLDTGILLSHEDLNVVGGYSAFGGSYNDDNGHGTHVAGTIAALNNNIGVIGAAPNASLYAVKVLDAGGSGSYAGIIDGINWAINNKMNVINMSLGGRSGSTALEDACNAAYNAGILVVAAAGNEGNNGGKSECIGYPARYASVMAVGSITSNNTRSSFSSTGSTLEIMAPGSSILSTTYNGGYGTMSGTSMACPHVAGVAALVWSAKPTMTNVQLRNVLNTTANNMWNDPWKYGNGLVDAYAAYMAVK
jgi:subtilisin